MATFQMRAAIAFAPDGSYSVQGHNNASDEDMQDWAAQSLETDECHFAWLTADIELPCVLTYGARVTPADEAGAV